MNNLSTPLKFNTNAEVIQAEMNYLKDQYLLITRGELSQEDQIKRMKLIQKTAADLGHTELANTYQAIIETRERTINIYKG